MTVSTQPLTLRGNTSPPVFLLTLIRGSRLHHTHSFGFAVSTMQKVKEDIWCCREKRERWGSGREGKEGGGGRGVQRCGAQLTENSSTTWTGADKDERMDCTGYRLGGGGVGGTDRLKHRLNRGGQYAWLLNEEPARLKSKDGVSQGNGGSGERRGEERR